MKKVVAVFLCLLIPAGLFAQFRTALGASFAGDYAVDRTHIGLGGAVHVYFEWMPILGMIGINATFTPEGSCVRITADYRIINEGSEAVKFTLGIGEYFDIYAAAGGNADSFYYYDDGATVRGSTYFLGLRIPVGLSLYPEVWLEFFGEIALAFGLELFGDWSFALEFQSSAGVRFWL